MRPLTGADWLDLVATVTAPYGPAPRERLPDPAELAAWLAAHGLAPATAPGTADLHRAHTVREGLRGLGLATVRGTEWPPDAVQVVNWALAGDRHLTLTTPQTGALEPPPNTRAALARLARQAAEQLTGPAAAALHQCAEPDCGMLFLDPGGRRRWCAAEICGVRHRVREHRKRAAAHQPAHQAQARPRNER